MPNKKKGIKEHGFTLIEVAVSVLIMALLVTGLSSFYSKKIVLMKKQENLQRLLSIKQHLLNYLEVNGVLPCPDVDGDGLQDRKQQSNGVSTCKQSYGYLPHGDLALGFAADPWDSPYAYAVNRRATEKTRVTDVCEPASLFAKPGDPVHVGKELGNQNRLLLCPSTGLLYCARNSGETLNPNTCKPQAGLTDDCVCLVKNANTGELEVAEQEINTGADFKNLLEGAGLPVAPPYISWFTPPVGYNDNPSATPYKNLKVIDESGEQIGGAIVAMIASYGVNGQYTWNENCPADLSDFEKESCDHDETFQIDYDKMEELGDRMMWIDIFTAKAALVRGGKL
jgi:prepilin-type N-terminal cleavage/methylation domain-containing protein